MHTLIQQEKNGPIISGSFSCYSLLSAVFAENQQEHFIEKKREEYIRSMIDDLGRYRWFYQR
jgi:hypothetical protein